MPLFKIATADRLKKVCLTLNEEASFDDFIKAGQLALQVSGSVFITTDDGFLVGDEASWRALHGGAPSQVFIFTGVELPPSEPNTMPKPKAWVLPIPLVYQLPEYSADVTTRIAEADTEEKVAMLKRDQCFVRSLMRPIMEDILTKYVGNEKTHLTTMELRVFSSALVAKFPTLADGNSPDGHSFWRLCIRRRMKFWRETKFKSISTNAEELPQKIRSMREKFGRKRKLNDASSAAESVDSASPSKKLPKDLSSPSADDELSDSEDSRLAPKASADLACLLSEYVREVASVSRTIAEMAAMTSDGHFLASMQEASELLEATFAERIQAAQTMTVPDQLKAFPLLGYSQLLCEEALRVIQLYTTASVSDFLPQPSVSHANLLDNLRILLEGARQEFYAPSSSAEPADGNFPEASDYTGS